MSGYKTWVCGSDVLFYDKEVVKYLKDDTFWWRLSYRYQSVWRNMHIDGFEGYLWNRHELPKYQGVRYNFFTYATPTTK